VVQWRVCSRSVSRVTSSERMIFAGREFFPLTHYRRLRARLENPENPRGHSHAIHTQCEMVTDASGFVEGEAQADIVSAV